ncbi:MAG: hypothetical protein EXX96DRAFT_557138 [Benjaminiella poitrasii]|nr:MAG: hypothetical protein EXX96DRAFT_557138 [Benjaminiella poitrasii]
MRSMTSKPSFKTTKAVWGFMLENTLFTPFEEHNHAIIEQAYRDRKKKPSSHSIDIIDGNLPKPYKAKVYFGVAQNHLRMPGTRYYVLRMPDSKKPTAVLQDILSPKSSKQAAANTVSSAALSSFACSLGQQTPVPSPVASVASSTMDPFSLGSLDPQLATPLLINETSSVITTASNSTPTDMLYNPIAYDEDTHSNGTTFFNQHDYFSPLPLPDYSVDNTNHLLTFPLDNAITSKSYGLYPDHHNNATTTFQLSHHHYHNQSCDDSNSIRVDREMHHDTHQKAEHYSHCHSNHFIPTMQSDHGDGATFMDTTWLDDFLSSIPVLNNPNSSSPVPWYPYYYCYDENEGNETVMPFISSTAASVTTIEPYKMMNTNGTHTISYDDASSHHYYHSL